MNVKIASAIIPIINATMYIHIGTEGGSELIIKESTNPYDSHL